jgi:hypothetical protein
MYTLQHVVEFDIHAFFLDEKVLLLPVVVSDEVSQITQSKSSFLND